MHALNKKKFMCSQSACKKFLSCKMTNCWLTPVYISLCPLLIAKLLLHDMVKVLRADLLGSANICFKCENSQREPDKKDSVKIKLKYIGKALKEKKK